MQGRSPLTTTTTTMNEGAFSVHCCDCNTLVGTTDCEVTATSPCHCETCHDEYLNELRDNGVKA